MRFFLPNYVALAFALLATANSHMIMLNPPPYGQPDSSPLEASGSNFPCKSTSISGAPVTDMPVGSNQTLKFKGSAVHGGGSCQVSITTDNPATKSSKWQVIHSIMGGCPARGQNGNEGDNPNNIDPDTYSFTIPDGVKAGTYTLAWTWYNRIGNRELYMNCASVKISGGSSKRDVFDNETIAAIPKLDPRDTSFPDMFIANAPTSNCVTPDNHDVIFPNPGSSVEKDGDPANLAPPTGSGCNLGPAGIPGGGSSGSDSGSGSGSAAGAGAGGAGSGAGAGGSGSGSGASAGGARAGGASSSGGASSAGGSAPTAAPGSGTASSMGSDTGSGVDSQGAPPSPAAALSSPAAPAAAPAGSSNASYGSSPGTGASSGASPAANSAGGAGAGGTGSGGGSATSCSTPGQSICSPDGKKIGTCADGGVVMQPVPAGTVCRGGLIQWPQKGRLLKRSRRLSDQLHHYDDIE